MDENVPSGGELRAERHGMAWLGGVILILVGIFFLVHNLTGFHINNWWALFILIPALGSLSSAWRFYRIDGRVSERVRGPLIGALVLLFVTAMFLFSLPWGKLWPVFLIIAGLGALAGFVWRD